MQDMNTTMIKSISVPTIFPVDNKDKRIQFKADKRSRAARRNEYHNAPKVKGVRKFPWDVGVVTGMLVRPAVRENKKHREMLVINS
jgi:hypothetical protein